MNVRLRPERPEDETAIRRVHEAAFPTAAEADLVDHLRAAGKAMISLVASLDGLVVGHVLFSPVTIDGKSVGLGLAPLAVLPEHQRNGIGSKLVEEGLAVCRRDAVPLVVLLGHPEYYPRFGFRRASDRGLRNEYDADDAFMVIELRPGGIPKAGGLVRYADEFGQLSG
jgi:putative acetyltransferase